MRLLLFSVLLTLAVVLPSLRSAEPVPTPPESLAFWYGEWEVTGPAGELLGHNRIEPRLGGWAVVEQWTEPDRSAGMSWFYYSRPERRWKQVWVTDSGQTKEKAEVANAPPGTVRFQGEIVAADHRRRWLDRTTLTPHPDGTVTQMIEVSLDRGVTWEQRFVGLYRRTSLPSPRP